MDHSLDTKIRLPQPPEELFPFFSDAANLELITPPELGFSIVSSDRLRLDTGAHIRYRLRLWGVPFGWTTRIGAWAPPHQFIDEQLSGPFKRWQHRHVLQATDRGTTMHDHVDYALPFAPAGEMAHRLVRRQLQRIFSYRHEAMLRLFSVTTDQPFIIHFDQDSQDSENPPLAERPASAARTTGALE